MKSDLFKENYFFLYWLIIKLSNCQILLLLLLAPFAASGQDEEATKPKKLMVGLSFSPDYCFRTLKAESSHQFIVEERNETEIPKVGFTAGAELLWQVHKRMDLQTGVYYSNKGYKTDKHSLTWTSSDPNFPVNYQIRYRYQYFDIPVRVNYYILTSKLKVFVTGGIVTNVFNRQQTKLILEEADGSDRSTLSDTDLGFSAITISALTGIGIFYPVSKSFSFKIQPVFSQSLTALKRSTDLKEKLYSAGVEVGFYYAFK